MAKKKNIKKDRRIKIYTLGYAGYLDEMPEDLRLAREARKEARKVKQ